MPDKTPAIYWIRKDLRLTDNRALLAACEDARPVIPVFIREDDSAGALGGAQAWWLERSLARLAEAYEKSGSRLILKSGDPADVIFALIAETGAQSVFWNRRYTPDGIETDTALKKKLKDAGLHVESFAGHILHEPSKFKTKSGGPYKVYTPFWKAFSAESSVPDPLDAPEKLTAAKTMPESEKLSDWGLYPGKPDWAADFDALWTPGEAGARDRLERFIDEIAEHYAASRDRPDIEATSMLSPHLALGEISPATIWHRIDSAKNLSAENRKKFLQELVWRDFCHHLLFHAPALATKNWNDRFDGFEWVEDDNALAAWRKGETGYPIVDAGLRQLWREGTMHNRVRMIAASFLVKDLMIDWRKGEEWFRDTLVDADPASNPANWQWVAGSGADASPFFRIFNPVLQGEKFDPDGAYVRRYVPELAALPAKHIHAPFDAPKAVLEEAGVTLGETYPEPIVDHKAARKRALAAFEKIKD
ncbi:deoxyribodipyrimidine photo-lyase [Martelella lutilitoris]|uniref:Deoxyribodipyrimidine photo-lyase n=1 Tax=Martelella lutilitoris TaxID=2583532 RepID=A0A7T7HGN1_9HYPH|nr:deoxyribodipyrimidine photo-lyase [Martelella lutilitoris]QQM28860.1 deoxyribodipyrimidine photo-lyase [Martelella lutilitoris]